MLYTIYKITNIVNNKTYIGKHQTKNLDDEYMGSGLLIKSAIEKYGLENFTKEILFQFDNEKEMNAKEAEIVTEEFVQEKTNYNLCPGGKGGWGFVNSNKLNNKKSNKVEIYFKISTKVKGQSRPETSKKLKELYKLGKRTVVGAFANDGVKEMQRRSLTHNANIKRKNTMQLSGHSKGSKNSQFETMWITNGKENQKVSITKLLEQGWHKGRTITPVPRIKKNIEICSSCRQEEFDKKWWNAYLDSKKGVSEFVKDDYPRNRAAFYLMKKRINS